MAVEYEISSDVATIKDVASNTQVASIVKFYTGSITYDDEPTSKYASVTINGKTQRVMLCVAVSGTVNYDDVPCLYSTVSGHRTLNVVEPTETGTPDDVPSLYETVVVDGKTVRALRCVLINATPNYDGVSSTCTFTDNGKTHTAQLVNKIVGGSIEIIVKGVSPLSLPDAVANSLSYVKAFGGTKQGLPGNYTQVNYVTNTAQTAVDTGIMIDFAKNYEFEVECRATTGSWYILQSRASSSGNITGIHGATSGSTITLVIGNVTVCTSAITRTVGNKLYVKATLNNGTATLYVKDETANTEDTQTGSYGTSQPNPTAAVYLLGNAGGQYADINSDIYMARIKENDTVVMDYVPARQVATAGFYDKASGTFKTALIPANLSADGNTVPTPDAPMDIVSNNGVIKLSPNLVEFNETRINSSTWANANKTKGFEVYADVYGKSVGDNMLTNANAFGVFVPCEYGNSVSINFFNYIPTYSRCYYCEITADGKCNSTPIRFSNGSTEIIRNTFDVTQTNSIGFIIEWYINSQQTRDYTASNYMVVKGSTPPTKYIPYGGIYTDGTVETVTVYSPTLIVESEVTDGIGINSQNGIPVANSDRCIFTPFFVKAGTKVTWSAKASNLGGYLIQYSQPVVSGAHWISSIAASPVEYIEGEYRRSATATVDCYVVCQGTASWSEMKNYNWRVTKPGSTATAEMLLKVGDYQDVQEILSGAVTRNIGVKVLDGTENWTVAGAGVPNSYWTEISGMSIGSNYIRLCSHFKQNTVYNNMANGEFFCGASTTRFNIRYDATSTVEQFKQWLAEQYAAGTPVIVVYPLATPTTESVTGQTLQVAQGDNVLEITQASIDGLELEAKYAAAVALTIQEVQDANLDPNVEVTII